MPSENDLRKLAVEYFQKAYERQMHGEYDEAIALHPVDRSLPHRRSLHLSRLELLVPRRLRARHRGMPGGHPGRSRVRQSLQRYWGLPDRARQMGGSYPLVREGHPRAALRGPLLSPLQPGKSIRAPTGMAESQSVLRPRHRAEPAVPAGLGGAEKAAGDVELNCFRRGSTRMNADLESTTETRRHGGSLIDGDKSWH